MSDDYERDQKERYDYLLEDLEGALGSPELWTVQTLEESEEGVKELFRYDYGIYEDELLDNLYEEYKYRVEAANV